MPNRKQIIVISVLCVLALMLGYWTAPLFDDNGDKEASVKPVVDDNATKTVIRLTEEEKKVVGVYTRKNRAGGTYKRVFLDNGVIEYYNNDKKEQKEAKWSIVNGEIHWEMADGRISVVRINNDGSFTSFQVDGTLGFTYKKIKPVVDDNATKTVIRLTEEEEKVVGVYTRKNRAGGTYKRVFLDNGVIEFYDNGKKLGEDGKWEVVDGELHVTAPNGSALVLRINKDRSMTHIAKIDEDGERKEVPKQSQKTFKKINNATTPAAESVAAIYEWKVEDEGTWRMVLLENGGYEIRRGGRIEAGGYWKIVDGEMHLSEEDTIVFRINKDRSITYIAKIGEDGKREEAPKEEQITAKKIK